MIVQLRELLEAILRLPLELLAVLAGLVYLAACAAEGEAP